METTLLYKCLSDESRLRILNLLKDGPLCGCHFIEALGIDQVKISKQLNYMKRLGLLSAQREANWMIYRLAEPVPPLLEINLQALRAARKTALSFARDEKRLALIKRRISRALDSNPQAAVPAAVASACCPPS